MPDCMTFPDTVEEFMDSYKIVDTEHVYTNGTEMIPIYRMRQWFQHEPDIVRCKDCKHHWTHRCMDSMPTEICELGQTFYDANVDFCSLAERRTDETD